MNQTQKQLPDGIDIRYTEAEDVKHLKNWLMEEETSLWFPMCDEIEREDAAVRWVAFFRFKCSLTLTKDGIPCGIATLYLQPYKQLVHQCEFGIILGKDYRHQGLGGYLLLNLMHLAKEKFKIHLLHLQVHSENPAINFYKHYGFKEFGRQNGWMKEKDGYVGRVFMERLLS